MATSGHPCSRRSVAPTSAPGEGVASPNLPARGHQSHGLWGTHVLWEAARGFEGTGVKGCPSCWTTKEQRRLLSEGPVRQGGGHSVPLGSRRGSAPRLHAGQAVCKCDPVSTVRVPWSRTPSCLPLVLPPVKSGCVCTRVRCVSFPVGPCFP